MVDWNVDACEVSCDWNVDAWKLSSEVRVVTELISDEMVAPSPHGELGVHGSTLVWICECWWCRSREGEEVTCVRGDAR
jgi:hypothetical protein